MVKVAFDNAVHSKLKKVSQTIRNLFNKEKFSTKVISTK